MRRHGEADRRPSSAVPVRVRLDRSTERHRAVVGGLRRWHELVLLCKIHTGDFGEDDACSAERRLRELRTEHEDLRADVTRLADKAAQTGPLSNWQRLRTDGIALAAAATLSTSPLSTPDVSSFRPA